MNKHLLRRLKFKLIVLCSMLLMLFSFVLTNYSNKEYMFYNISKVKHMNADLGNATQIDDNTLLEISTLDGLELNFDKLPTVTYTGSYEAKIEGEDGVDRERPGISGDKIQQPIKSITFSDVPFDAAVDIGVTATFENCGTLHDKAIDIVIKYSDFYSASKTTGSYNESRYNPKVLWWTAYGTVDNQVGTNEWFQRGWESINMKVYFYYHGESTPIPLNVAYFTLYSEDGNTSHAEAASSQTASQVFLFEETTMAYQASATYGSKTYTDIFYGTADHDDSAPKKAAVSFQYKNMDCIDVNMHVLTGLWAAGYHVNFYALSATLPTVPTKSVSESKATTGTELIYTILQDMPTATDDNFKLSSLQYNDTLDTNGLTYKSFNVYNESGKDITSLAGTLTQTDGDISYTFSSTYLQSLTYTGQTYKIIIKANIKDDAIINQIENVFTTNINNSFTLTSNIVNTDIISFIKVNYIDDSGGELAESETIEGRLLEEYVTEPLVIEKYELFTMPENATGTFTSETIEITYVYRKAVKDLEIYKIWDDNEYENRPTLLNITVTSSLDQSQQTIELNNTNGWYYKLADLDKWDDTTGEEIIYTVTEDTVPDGYYISGTTVEENIVRITNTKYGSLIVNNIDGDTKENLVGSKFVLEKKKNGEWVQIGEFETDENGEFSVPKLEHGNYKVTQIKVVEGYKLNTEKYEFTVTSSQADYKIEVPNILQAVLPAAGGTGITIILILGIVVMIIGAKSSKVKHSRSYKLRHKY